MKNKEIKDDDSLQPNAILKYRLKIRGDIVKVYMNDLLHMEFFKSDIIFKLSSI